MLILQLFYPYLQAVGNFELNGIKKPLNWQMKVRKIDREIRLPQKEIV